MTSNANNAPAGLDPTRAVVFDMDGVILDSEHIWERVMYELFAAFQLDHCDLDQDSLVGGDNSRQWAVLLREAGGIPLNENEILEWVTTKLLEHYTQALPLAPGALDTVTRLASSYRLAVASSSPRKIIAFVLRESGLERFFTAWASSDDVPRGKPAPDVYLRACSLLGIEPRCCVAVEDSRVGIQAAHAAGMRVIAVPPPSAPLEQAALDQASLSVVDLTLPSISELTAERVRSILLSCPEPRVC